MASRSLTEVLRETLALFEESGAPWTTVEVADRLDIGRRSTYERLERLVELDRLETKTVGANGRVWWQPGTAAPTSRSRETPDRPAERPLIDDVLDAAAVGVFVLDENFDVAWINDTAERYFRLDREAVVGKDKRKLVAERIEPLIDDGEAFKEAVLATYDDNTYTEEFECHVAAGEDREARWLEHRSEPIETGAYAGGRIELYYDVTDRQSAQTDLARRERTFRAVFEESFDAMMIADDDREYVDVNPAAAELFGLSEEELLGRSIAEFAAEDYDVEQAWQEFQESDRDRGLFPLIRADGERRTVEFAATPQFLPGRHLSVMRDVTDRKERERRYDAIFNQTYQFTGLMEPDGTLVEANDSALEFGGFEREDVVGEKFWDTKWFQHGETIESVREAVERARDGTFVREELEIQGADRTAIVDFSIRPITDERGDLVYLIPEGRDITDRVEAERQLEHHRKQLVVLNNINDVVRGITDAVIDQSTREEIESVVCERLAEADSYESAWIGDIDVGSQTVSVRTEAGVEGHLDGVTISVDPDDTWCGGLPARALRTGEMQTTRDVHDGDRPVPPRDYDWESTCRSSASIPIVHEHTVYGVLNVYAERPDAFEGSERAVIGQLGEVVGHAIAATERKQALLSDEVVELEFRIPDVSESIGVDTAEDGRITIDHVVATSDDAYLVYGTTTPAARETLDALTARQAHWESATVISEEEDTARFEARVTELPFGSEVVSQGGCVEDITLEGGNLYLRIHLPPSLDAKSITETVRATYPTAQTLAKRQFARPVNTVTPVQQTLDRELTDRQQAVLEAAYFGGLFEWPRDTSATDLADSLGIAPPTFSQHLRNAEKRVFDSLFSSAAPASPSPGGRE